MKRALVLGGGGAVGIAWEAAIIGGLLDAGVDLRRADLIVGTSAGSVVGTHLAHGADPREVLGRREAAAARGGRPASDTEALTAVFSIWGTAAEMTAEVCARIGEVALGARTMPEETWLRGFAGNGWPGWPDKPLVITAVDCDSGAFRAFDRDSGVPIELAAAASCAVPGMFPPVTIAGGRYMDGGVRSGTSGDLAQRIEPDVVLMLSPMGARGLTGLIARQLAREKGELEAAGASVKIMQFDDAAREAGAANLMDHARVSPVAVAGAAHAARLAGELRDWWDGRGAR